MTGTIGILNVGCGDTKLTLKAGQIWKEKYTRQERYVRVLKISGDYVQIFTCTKDGIHKKGCGVTTAKRQRFGGGSHGYVYHGEAPPDGTEMVPNGSGGVAIQGLTRPATGQRADVKVIDEIPARETKGGRS